ncbi:hypothetical protein T439DRAFT_358845 [Meredithblackwellia eburnea MCA 4105]
MPYPKGSDHHLRTITTGLVGMICMAPLVLLEKMPQLMWFFLLALVQRARTCLETRRRTAVTGVNGIENEGSSLLSFDSGSSEDIGDDKEVRMGPDTEVTGKSEKGDHREGGIDDPLSADRVRREMVYRSAETSSLEEVQNFSTKATESQQVTLNGKPSQEKHVISHFIEHLPADTSHPSLTKVPVGYQGIALPQSSSPSSSQESAHTGSEDMKDYLTTTVNEELQEVETPVSTSKHRGSRT